MTPIEQIVEEVSDLVKAARPFVAAFHNAEMASDVLAATHFNPDKLGNTLLRLDMPSKSKMQTALAASRVSHKEWRSLLKAYVKLMENPPEQSET